MSNKQRSYADDQKALILSLKKKQKKLPVFPPTSLCVHQWRIYFLLVTYLEIGSG